VRPAPNRPPCTRSASCWARAEKGARADDDRQRLDQRRARARIHAAHQFQHGLGRDEAVSVEFEHVLVTAAPALDEIVDVALLLLGVLAAAAIPERLDRAAAQQVLDRLFLDLGEGRVHRVADEEKLEAGFRIQIT
jgi:hypothetical protein